MRIKRQLRRYRGEIKIVFISLVVCLLFGIYNLVRVANAEDVNGSTLSTHDNVLPSASPTNTPQPTLVIPTTIQINIYINNTNPIYNQLYNSYLSPWPTTLITQVSSNTVVTATTTPTLISIPTNIPTQLPTLTPTITPTPTQVSLLSSFTGKYFNNIDLTGISTLIRNDERIFFNWGSGSPDILVSNDKFSVRWEGYINSTGGEYQIKVKHDDALRVYIDNMIIHDHWINQSSDWEFVTKNLSPGRHMLKIEYYENTGGAVIYFDIQKV